ncbi:ABC transporter permease [Intestinicryptomonas porci]|uniref:ABC transporter permease subunit n=1 Tax=Intestinicryptomonas porci TaxID=2926320 RepID=A0ABU4WF93_9BACT|nr:ABC transporter permease subunit [Opitutales bacterium CLA-KB-P66]
MKSRFTSLLVTLFALAFLYIPILTLVMQSFNSSRFGGEWKGFSLKWYEALFNDAAILDATLNTLIIAFCATILSTILGTLSAWALHRFQTKLQEANYTLVYAPLIMPDILMGISLLLLFVSIGADLGLVTVVIAHTTFCVSYVAFTVLARLQDFDFSIIQAAQDLGAGWGRIIRQILLPLLWPGIAAGAMMAFTLSMDDFVVTFFVGGPGSTTLPVKVFSMMKHGSPAIINALSVIFMSLTFTVAIAGQIITNKKSHK